jgi:hypothetical protein
MRGYIDFVRHNKNVLYYYTLRIEDNLRNGYAIDTLLDFVYQALHTIPNAICLNPNSIPTGPEYTCPTWSA